MLRYLSCGVLFLSRKQLQMPLLKALTQVFFANWFQVETQCLAYVSLFRIAQRTYAMLMDALQIYDVTKYLS